MQVPYGILDAACPLEPGHPLNVGIVEEWAVSPLPGWSRGLTFRSLVRGGHNPHDGTLTSGPTWQGSSGRPGGYGALSFDNNYLHRVDIPDSPCLQLTSQGTVAAWMKLAAFPGSSFQGLLDKYGGAFGDGYSLYWSVGDESVRGEIYNGGNQGGGGGTNTVVAGTSTVTDTTSWHHFVFTWDGSNLHIYQDGGRFTNSTAQTLNAMIGTKVPTIGACVSAAHGFNGLIDGVQVYGRALSAAEVVALYQETRLGNPNRWRWLKSTDYSFPAAGGGTTHTYSLGDKVALKTSVTRLLNPSRMLQDKAALKEARSRLLNPNRIVLDNLSVRENLIRHADASRPVSDKVALREAVLRHLDPNRALSNKVGVRDSLATMATALRSLANKVALKETLIRHADAGRPVSDRVAVRDSLLRHLDASRPLSDRVGVGDVTARHLDALRKLSNLLGVTDRLDWDLITPGLIIATVIDRLGMKEHTARLLNPARSVADKAALRDLVLRLPLSFRKASDRTGLRDLESWYTTYSRLRSDKVGLREATARHLDPARLITDKVGVKDLTFAHLLTAQVLTYLLKDRLGLREHLDRHLDASRLIVSRVGIRELLLAHRMVFTLRKVLVYGRDDSKAKVYGKDDRGKSVGGQ